MKTSLLLTILFTLLSFNSFASEQCSKEISHAQISVDYYLMIADSDIIDEGAEFMAHATAVAACSQVDFVEVPTSGCEMTNNKNEKELVLGYYLEKKCWML
jgi:formylmethanofuran dehydrogenase subunit A